MKIIENKDKSKLRQLATSELSSLIKKNNDKPILFLTSGGSSIELLENLQVDHPKLSIGVLDERYSTDPTANNFAQLLETSFYKENEKHIEKVLDTRVKDRETLEELSQRFEDLLKTWKENNPSGIIIATLGVGPDGHISGINPHADNTLFNNERSWVVGYESTLKPAFRVTTTFPFLRLIDYGVSFVTGENKKEAFTRILSDEGNISDTPGRILHEMRNVILFTDIGINS